MTQLQTPSMVPLAIVPLEAIRQRAKAIHQVMTELMQEGQHYYALGQKSIRLSDGNEFNRPNFALSKSGAELLCIAFQLSPRLTSQIIDRPDESRSGKAKRKEYFDGPRGQEWKWVEAPWQSTGFYEAISTCEICGPTGNLLSSAQGTCSNLEAAYRDQNYHDLKNTIVKMSQKRAYVAAVLLATAASDIFTQDEEEAGERGLAKPAPAAPSNGLTVKQNALAAVKARQLGLTPEELDSFMHWFHGLNKGAKMALEDLSAGGDRAGKVVHAWREHLKKSTPTSEKGAKG